MLKLLKLLRKCLTANLNTIVVGVIVAVVAGFILFYLLDRDTKGLTYTTLVNSPLLTVSDEIGAIGALEIRLNGEVVSNPYLYVVRVESSGNIPIAPQDYVIPLSLDFGDAARILGVEITEARSAALRQDCLNNLNYSDGNLILPSVLLNEADFYTVKVIVAQPGESIDPLMSGRIIGIGKINRETVGTGELYIPTWVYATAAVIFLISYIALAFIARRGLATLAKERRAWQTQSEEITREMREVRRIMSEITKQVEKYEKIRDEAMELKNRATELENRAAELERLMKEKGLIE